MGRFTDPIVNLLRSMGVMFSNPPTGAQGMAGVNFDSGGNPIDLQAPDGTTHSFPGAVGPGTGDVNGPSSATIGSIAIYSSTTGKLIGELTLAQFNELIDDRVAALCVAGTNFTNIVYNDALGTLTFNAATQGGGGGGLPPDGTYGNVTVSGTGTVWTINSGAITLAMMANLAQDQFIGRTSASTGVPQTATITAAARTVLDDATVAAMVDTLGGAAAGGTGGLARLIGPAFTNPDVTTQTAGNNSTKAASTAYADAAASTAAAAVVANNMTASTTVAPSKTAAQTAIDAKVADDLTANASVAPSKNAVIAALALKRDGLQPEQTVASATMSTDVPASTSEMLNMTGTTTVTALGTMAAGTWRWIRSTAAVQITHNATSLISPTGGNLSMVTNDIIGVQSLGAGNWRIRCFIPASISAAGALLTANALSELSGSAATARSNIGAQTQDATLDALAALVIVANSMTLGTGTDAFSQITIAANQFLARSSSGGVAAKALTDFALTLLDDADAATMRTTLSAQALDATLTALAALTIAADSMTVGTGADAFTQITLAANQFLAKASTGAVAAKAITDFALTILDDADAATARTTLGAQPLDATLTALAALTIVANSLTLGTGTDAFSQLAIGANQFPARASTGNVVAQAITDFAMTILDDVDAAAVRTTIGAQPLDATLTALAALTIAANSMTLGTGADAFSQITIAANQFLARASTGNVVAQAITDYALTLLDDADAATARTTLGAAADLAGYTLGSGTTAITHATHANRVGVVNQAGATSGTFAGTATSGALIKDSIYLRNIGAGLFTASGTITAATGFKLTARTGEVFTADYDSVNDNWVSTTPVVPTSANAVSMATAADYAAMKTLLSLVVGTDVQAADATLTAFAALTIAANSMTLGTGADAFSQITIAANQFLARSSSGNVAAKAITDFGLSLVDDADAATGRTTLGAAKALTQGTTISASRNLAAGDIGQITRVDTGGGAVVLTLNSSTIAAGDRMFFQRNGANALTIVTGTATVSNPDSITVADGGIIGLVGDLRTAGNGVLV